MNQLFNLFLADRPTAPFTPNFTRNKNVQIYPFYKNHVETKHFGTNIRSHLRSASQLARKSKNLRLQTKNIKHLKGTLKTLIPSVCERSPEALKRPYTRQDLIRATRALAKTLVDDNVLLPTRSIKFANDF